MTALRTGPQFLRFLAVGAIGTAAHYALLILLVEAYGVWSVLASTCGFLLGAFVNYVLSRLFVFETTRSHASSIPKFLFVAATGVALNAGAMALLVNGFQWPYLPSQVGVTGCLVGWHYAANRFWTFRAKT